MFMNTIAVGPLEEVSSCVTGGTRLALVRAELDKFCPRTSHEHVVGAAAYLGKHGEDQSFEIFGSGFRSDIVTWNYIVLEFMYLYRL